MSKIRIADEYKWLYRVPKHAIVDYLQAKDEASVREAVGKLDERLSGTILSILIKCDLKQLIYLFQKCSATTPEDASSLYRQYRYRGMKNLHLYSREGKCRLYSLNISALNRVITTKAAALVDSAKKFCDLEIRRDESIDKGSIREFSYTYCGFIPYIPPDTQYPNTVRDLRSGFVWVPYHDPWICICAKDATIANVLHESLQDYFGFKSRALPLTKTVQQKLENMEDIRKAGYLSPSGTTRRYTNPHMANDLEAMEECRRRDNSDDRHLAGFNVDLEEVSFALSYNESGYIYFSRDLTVDQMREWGVTKVREVVKVITELRLTEPSALLGENLTSLNGIPKDAKSSIVDITSAIMRCKNEKISDIPLRTDVFLIAQRLRKYTKTRFRVYCGKCNDHSEVVCECGSIDFAVDPGHMRCEKCNTVDPKISCFDGHRNSITKVEECIELLPLKKLNDLVSQILEEETDARFDPLQESFSVRNNRLFYRQDAGKTVYRLGEIPEFKLALVDVPEAEFSPIKKAVATFAEKCPEAGTVNCANCIERNIGKKCYLRLFGLFDPNYEPRPHHGHEFGDYSTHITIDNRQKTTVIAMKALSKRERKGNRKVTLRSELGSDLYSQVGGYLHDGRIDVVGVCLPRKLDEGFAASLKKDVQDKNKQLLIIDDDDLVQIAYSAMKRRNMELSEI